MESLFLMFKSLFLMVRSPCWMVKSCQIQMFHGEIQMFHGEIPILSGEIHFFDGLTPPKAPRKSVASALRYRRLGPRCGPSAIGERRSRGR
jgi:hypothetical protein